MIRPDLGSVAEELYGRLEPFHEWTDPNNDTRTVSDEDLNWPLFLFFGMIAKQWQEVEDLSRDSDAGPGWSALQDIDRIPDKGLGWLGQFKGKTLLPDATPEEHRARIRGTDGFDRGTADAFREAAKRHLVAPPGEEPEITINERLGGDLWTTGVITKVDQTPDPAQTFKDLLEQKPYGILLVYEVLDAWNYTAIKVAFDDYGEIKVHYADYEGLKENNPPAPGT